MCESGMQSGDKLMISNTFLVTEKKMILNTFYMCEEKKRKIMCWCCRRLSQTGKRLTQVCEIVDSHINDPAHLYTCLVIN